MKKALNRFWTKAVPPEIEIIPETTFYVDDHQFYEPDFFFGPATIDLADISAATALLVVEVAASSLSYDLGKKAKNYAKLGFREFWVVDAGTLVTHIHRNPVDGGYRSRTRRAQTQLMTPHLAPVLAVRLADLD